MKCCARPKSGGSGRARADCAGDKSRQIGCIILLLARIGYRHRTAGGGMPKFLKLYLIVTGGLGFLAIAMPGLVILGFFMLIIPGLILSLAPTAFLWGCAYAVAHWLARSRLRPGWVALGAVPLTALILCAIPLPSILMAQAKLARYHLSAVKPANPIRPAGDIRLDRSTQSSGCDSQCLALLFEPGVRSVTVNTTREISFAQIRDGLAPLTQHARTFRLKPAGQCAAGDPKPEISGANFGKTWEDNRAMAAEWKARLTSESCLSSSLPIARYDLLLRSGAWRVSDEPGERTSADYAEIRTGANRLLMRVFNLRTSSLQAPLNIAFTGGIENFRPGWGRSQWPRGVSNSWEAPGHELDAALAVRRSADQASALAITRAALSAAVANPALRADAPIFQSVGDYLEMLKPSGALPADRLLVERLIADPRLEDLEGAGLLPKIFNAGELAELRPAIIAKLSALPATADPRTRALGAVLKSWPVGAFAQLSSDERVLLKDVDRRRRATGLIERLYDLGPAGAPMLVQILDEHQRAKSTINRDDPSRDQVTISLDREAHGNAQAAAIRGLCQLGPAAKGELGGLMGIEQRSPKKDFGGRDWDRMMVRVGKPVDQVSKPENLSGSEANYQRNLREFLHHFRPDQSCR